MSEIRKTVFTRDGVDREYTDHEIHVFQPEQNGWTKKEVNELDAAAAEAAAKAEKLEQDKQAQLAAEEAEKKAAAEAAAKAASESGSGNSGEGVLSIEGKTSKDFKGTDVEALTPLLKSLTIEQLEAFFANEDRQFMNKLHNDLKVVGE